MGRRYEGNFSNTNTTSTTNPLGGLIGAATTRARVYDITVGAAATPADNYAQFAIRRTTTAGTSSATWTPTALDVADPASLLTFVTAWSAQPTITANSDIWQTSMNQRATYRWVAAPLGELVLTNSATVGMVVMPVGSNATASYNFNIYWEE